MSHSFRHAICNEVYKDWNFRDACRSIHATGYAGIEIAPFTLAEDPSTISVGQRAEYRATIEYEGLTFVGLHWLMVSPKGLHVTTPDTTLRKRSWEHIRNLIDLCADLGPSGVMVFGSPQQRSTTGGLTPAEARKNYIDGLAGVAPHADERGVRILIEALPSNQSNVITSLEDAVSVVREICSPAVFTMFDTHNAVEETESHAVLVDRYFEMIQHVHVNEIDGKHPGTGDYDFKPVLQVLRDRGYNGWVSLEAFDFAPGSERIAKESIQHLQSVIGRLAE